MFWLETKFNQRGCARSTTPQRLWDEIPDESISRAESLADPADECGICRAASVVRRHGQSCGSSGADGMGGDPRRAAGGEFHEWTDWKGLPGSPNPLVECKVGSFSKTELLKQIKRYKRDDARVQAIIGAAPSLLPRGRSRVHGEHLEQQPHGRRTLVTPEQFRSLIS
jgi:hypothetical protein